jgi:hypothetical protein
VVAAVACAGPGVEVFGDAMVDVGFAIRDAGDSMSADAEATDTPATDALVGDVSVSLDSGPRPPRAVMAACDHVYTTVITLPTVTITQTQWRAEIDAPEATTTGAIPRFWVRTCDADRETFGPPASACPAGATCTGTAAVAPACYASGGGGIDEGRIIVNCGFRSQADYTNPATADTDSGSRLMRVEIEIE